MCVDLLNVEAQCELGVRDHRKCFLCLNVLHLGIDSISLDIGQIMCYSSQQLTLFGERTFLIMFQRKKEAVHVKHAKISLIIDKISTWADHICATLLWNKPSLVWLSSVFSFLSSVFSP